MSIHIPQNFYRETITRAVTLTGATNIYVSALPTPAEGFITIAPSSTSLREIIFYTAKGTDGNGSYITVTLANRGLGGTTAQTHAIGEPVRMNVDAETIQEISDALDQIVAGGAQDASTITKGIAKLSSAPSLATNPIALNSEEVAETGVSKVIRTKSTGLLDGSIIPSNSYVSSEFILGETISAGETVYVAPSGDGSTVAITQANTNNNYQIDANTWFSQSFVVGTDIFLIPSVVVSLANSGATGSVRCSIRSGTSPSGADIGTVVDVPVGSLSNPTTFSVNSPVIAGGTYSIVLRLVGGTGNVDLYTQSGNPYANGMLRSSATGGASWSEQADSDVKFTVNQTKTTAGRIYRANATANIYTDSFVGFLMANGISGGTGTVIHSGVVSLLTGLTTGTTYFLSNTSGTISISAGTVSKKVGLSTSSTSLLIKNDN